MVLLVLLLLALPFLLSFLLRKLKTKRNLHLPPGPKGLPFIGNLHQFDSLNPHSYLWQLSQKHGPVMSLRLGFVPILVVSSAKMAEAVMKTHDLIFCSRPALVGQQKLSAKFRPIREFELSNMLEKISKSAVASKPVNLSEALMSLTSTIICRIAFGKRYEEDGVGRSRFQELLKEAQALSTCFFIIQEHLDPSRSKPAEEDILDILLQLWKDRSFKVDLTFDNIKAVLMNVFVGGTDTRAATVVWAMTLLMKNPMAMKKAQEEVRKLVGRKDFVEEADCQQLPYLKAVIKETMRLQPTAPLLVPRESTEDCVLDGYDIAAKTVVYVNAWAIGRDPEIWENPEEFNPERFINSSIDLKGQDFELTPFGAGRRICPGIFMGLATVEVSLANLLHKFDWEMPVGMKKEDLDMDVQPGITMHKKNALCLMARKYA
uniref:Cytochrome P450 n=2 Tax=Manihot esculenta TaxID=3983 RepID=A0A2C9VWD1_MANES